ncbi:MAG: hydroxymethylglutaryl-CoA lyase [Planctomyces sp.]|nr:hydroxymethylglutaryl-CoA lyase [Planctomyces sp.]
MTRRVRITDVSPRDGLQNEPTPVATADKVRLVRAVMAAGVDEVEVSSFVSPRWVPQLGDAAEVFAALAQGGAAGVAGDGGAVLSALVPNERGLESALEVNRRAGFALIGKVSVFTAASETFAQRNTNGSIAQTLERFVGVIGRAKGAGLAVRGYVSCAIACPYEGDIEPGRVADVCARLARLGVDELDLGDTIGVAEPRGVLALIEAVGRSVPPELGGGGVGGGGRRGLTLHLHDTFGRAGACVTAALSAGVRSFDGAVGGLGGCPYASVGGRRAPGNIDTRALVAAVRAAGYDTGVDGAGLAAAAAVAQSLGVGHGGR